MNFLKTFLIAAAMSLSAVIAFAQQVPAPVHGVSFEEWASASARLANKASEEEVLKTLAIDKAQFDEVNQSFTAALKDDKDFKLITYYGQAFANLNAGRFAASTTTTKRKLVTFDDYARLTGHMRAATKLGTDPQKVLAEHGLTVYEFSQDNAYWIGKERDLGMSGNTAAIETWNAAIDKYAAEYAARDVGKP